MNRTGAHKLEVIDMLLGGVPFVPGESIARVEFIKLDHEVISGDFGNDGGTGDGKA